ncbi:outer-membrane lipoprotein carrier protein LolA, partial [Leptospira borgpetersenii serovar Ballum]|nr:outer-membrane lipoprotein carrier protein LolA [Leptospira borgpetersenii serovar Ballum]
MKRLLVACCFLSGLISASALADASTDLQNRLSKVNS